MRNTWEDFIWICSRSRALNLWVGVCVCERTRCSLVSMAMVLLLYVAYEFCATQMYMIWNTFSKCHIIECHPSLLVLLWITVSLCFSFRFLLLSFRLLLYPRLHVFVTARFVQQWRAQPTSQHHQPTHTPLPFPLVCRFEITTICRRYSIVSRCANVCPRYEEFMKSIAGSFAPAVRSPAFLPLLLSFFLSSTAGAFGRESTLKWEYTHEFICSMQHKCSCLL